MLAHTCRSSLIRLWFAAVTLLAFTVGLAAALLLGYQNAPDLVRRGLRIAGYIAVHALLIVPVWLILIRSPLAYVREHLGAEGAEPVLKSLCFSAFAHALPLVFLINILLAGDTLLWIAICSVVLGLAVIWLYQRAPNQVDKALLKAGLVP